MNNLVLPNMKALQWLMPIAKGCWNPAENKPASGSQVRRWINEGALEVNGGKIKAEEMIDFPVFSIVLFPKSQVKRVTLF